jgi:hypothetical protein
LADAAGPADAAGADAADADADAAGTAGAGTADADAESPSTGVCSAASFRMVSHVYGEYWRWPV